MIHYTLPTEISIYKITGLHCEFTKMGIFHFIPNLWMLKNAYGFYVCGVSWLKWQFTIRPTTKFVRNITKQGKP